MDRFAPRLIDELGILFGRMRARSALMERSPVCLTIGLAAFASYAFGMLGMAFLLVLAGE